MGAVGAERVEGVEGVEESIWETRRSKRSKEREEQEEERRRSLDQVRRFGKEERDARWTPPQPGAPPWQQQQGGPSTFILSRGEGRPVNLAEIRDWFPARAGGIQIRRSTPELRSSVAPSHGGVGLLPLYNKVGGGGGGWPLRKKGEDQQGRERREVVNLRMGGRAQLPRKKAMMYRGSAR